MNIIKTVIKWRIAIENYEKLKIEYELLKMEYRNVVAYNEFIIRKYEIALNANKRSNVYNDLWRRLGYE
jgi:hypothetical protein